MRKNLINNKKLWLFIGFVLYFSIAYSIMNHYGISCVFLHCFGIPCPGCGMTRAFLALLKLDFWEAFKYNALIFYMPYLFLYIFFDWKGHIHKFFLIFIGFSAIVNWVIKLLF